jgi:hypothetical protein
LYAPTVKGIAMSQFIARRVSHTRGDIASVRDYVELLTEEEPEAFPPRDQAAALTALQELHIRKDGAATRRFTSEECESLTRVWHFLTGNLRGGPMIEFLERDGLTAVVRTLLAVVGTEVESGQG